MDRLLHHQSQAGLPAAAQFSTVAAPHMVGDKGHSPAWPPAQQARSLALWVNQAPVLAIFDCLLEDALGHKVKQGAAAGLVKPVHQGLPGSILVVLQAIVPPPATMQMLADMIFWDQHQGTALAGQLAAEVVKLAQLFPM